MSDTEAGRLGSAYRARSWTDPRAEARPSPIHGNGLFAREPIREEEVVAIVGGDLMTDAEFRAFARSHARYNAMRIGENAGGTKMPQPDSHRSVSTVVFRGGGGVLLHLRGDVRIWSLPGGGGEPGEDLEAAAIREVHEETGYEIAVDRLVGEYRRPQIGDTKRLFLGRVTGGTPKSSPPESVRLAWFPADRLPSSRLVWLREYVEDAVANHPDPDSRTQMQTRRQILAMRDLFALSDLRDGLVGRRRESMSHNGGGTRSTR